MALTVMPRIAPFALLIPQSPAAIEAVKTKRNATRVVSLHSKKGNSTSKPQSAVKLNFAMFAGRRFLSFGSSGSASFNFAKESGLEEHHFLIHFDLIHRDLLVTDTSTSGVWVHDEDQAHPKLLLCDSIRVRESLRLSCGKDNRFRFRIQMCKGQWFARAYSAYIRTLDLPVGASDTPQLRKRKASCALINDQALPQKKICVV